MCTIGKLALWIGAVVALTCGCARACHVTVHYTKAEIEAADLRLYERDVKTRDLDVTGFDLKHALLGQLLGNQQVYEQDLADWKLHPKQFEHEHAALSRVLIGDMLYHHKYPSDPPAVTIPPQFLYPVDPGGTIPVVPTDPGGGNSDPDIHPLSIPEPGTGVLGLTALVAGTLAAICRWRSTYPDVHNVYQEELNI